MIKGNNDNAFSFLTGLQAASASSKDDGQWASEGFWASMTAQLLNQDLQKSLVSDGFPEQITAFSTVGDIGELDNSFEGVAQFMQSDQALRGSALVGRSVLVSSSIANLTSKDGITGQINVAEPVLDLKVLISTETGVRVRMLAIGPASGDTHFTWDGSDDDGQVVPAGVYQYKASGTAVGDNTVFATATLAKVDSVVVGNGNQGLTVNLAGIGSVPFSEVQEII